MAKLGHAEGAISKHSKELQNAVQDEARRREIDAAKKRAAAQNADYPTFAALVSLSASSFASLPCAFASSFSYLMFFFPFLFHGEMPCVCKEEPERAMSRARPKLVWPWICMYAASIILWVIGPMSTCLSSRFHNTGLNFRFHSPTMTNSSISSPIVWPGQ